MASPIGLRQCHLAFSARLLFIKVALSTCSPPPLCSCSRWWRSTCSRCCPCPVASCTLYFKAHQMWNNRSIFSIWRWYRWWQCCERKHKDDDSDDDEPESLTAGSQATAGLSRRAQAQQPSPHWNAVRGGDCDDYDDHHYHEMLQWWWWSPSSLSSWSWSWWQTKPPIKPIDVGNTRAYKQKKYFGTMIKSVSTSTLHKKSSAFGAGYNLAFTC